MKINFTERELKMIEGLADMALKSAGLRAFGQVNELVSYLNKEIMEASKAESPKSDPAESKAEKGSNGKKAKQKK